MKSDLTEIVCVVDRSGSMEPIRDDAIGGFNSFLEQQKRQPGRARLTLVLFNHKYKFLHFSAEIEDVPRLEPAVYRPDGTTALLDAIGRTIDDVESRIEDMPDSDRPARVVVAILTDGLENASTDYTRRQVFDRIKRLRKKNNWEFLFLGANQDAFQEARSLCINHAANWAGSSEGVSRAYDSMSSVVSVIRSRYSDDQDPVS